MILWTISETAMDLVVETDIYVKKKNHIIRAIANLCSLFQTMKKRSIQLEIMHYNKVCSQNEEYFKGKKFWRKSKVKGTSS